MADATSTEADARGVLGFMATNPVVANLLMALLLVGGLAMLSQLKREVFPRFELDAVRINVAYPGASPAEVEQGVVLALEEAVRGLDDVKEVGSTASEGIGTVTVELLAGANEDRVLADVKAAVDRITSFPEDIERPSASLVASQRAVLSLVVHGDADERTLRGLAESTRTQLLLDESITVAELGSVRPLEISIEVPQETLRRHGLTLAAVADAVRRAAVEIPAGGVKTGKGEVLIRLNERRDLGFEFEDIVVLSDQSGSELRLGDIATIVDGFRETDQEAFFNGKRAATVDVYRVGDEGPIRISEAVQRYVREHASALPPGVEFAIWNDRSETYKQRQDTLLKNAYLGLALVLLVLGLFLEIRLAFWATLGIPISFAGSLLLMPWFDVSINMISLFAFIVSLGLVVDDAIVVGEAVHKHRREGMARLSAAIAGVREVAAPVTFSILTTIIAFMPLLLVPGHAGKFFRNIPLVVISVLAVSLVESLFVLPAHLAEPKHVFTSVLSAPFRFVDGAFRLMFKGSLVAFVVRQQQRFSEAIERLVELVYAPFARLCIRWRYLTSACFVGALVLTLGLVASGRIQFTFLPKIDSDIVQARLETPVGTSVELTRRLGERMLESASATLDAHGGQDKLSRGVFSELSGGNSAAVRVFLVPSDEREVASREIARAWRERLGDIPGAERLRFTFSIGAGSSAPLHFRLSHADNRVLEQAAAQLGDNMREFEGTYDIDTAGRIGKEQLDLRLRPEARALGITQFDLARQVRSAFFGAEVFRQQRGREEVRVSVRRPRAERGSEHNIESFMVRTPSGSEIPLREAAFVTRGRAYTQIRRSNGRRVADVTCDVERGRGNANQIRASLMRSFLPELVRQHPGLSYELAGQSQNLSETNRILGRNFLYAVVVMFALLAIAFRSYSQPLIVLLAVPFGMIGAVLGHLALGYSLNLMTMMGVVALSGVVVNDSLLLVVAVNRFKAQGMSTLQAVEAGAKRRFRPILLTSLTTFLGLLPMITETSIQARFLIPMAISLAFGVLFATVLTLLLVPCTYVMLDDARALWLALAAPTADTQAPDRPSAAARRLPTT